MYVCILNQIQIHQDLNGLFMVKQDVHIDED